MSVITTARRILVISFLSALFVATTTIVARADTPFVSETVDSTGDVGEHTSIVLDEEDNVFISYYDDTNGELKYAFQIGGVWTAETVDTSGNVGQYSSLDLDGQGNPHIGYYDVANGDLKYAVKVGGSWSTESVDATGDVGAYASLELDRQGNPHIGYYDATNGDLMYAAKIGGSWTTEIADDPGNVGTHASLGLDDHGNPHLSYHDETNFSLKYATKSTGSWVRETVDMGGNFGSYTSIVLDPQGRPHISYQAIIVEFHLRYAVKTSGVWSVEAVDIAQSGGVSSSLALDALGNPHISYATTNGLVSALKYAVKTGGTWSFDMVDETGSVGWFTSLALDSHGIPYVSYYDISNGDLKLADAAVHLTSPLGGERWIRETEATVTWDGAGAVDILLSTDGGLTYSPLRASVSGRDAPVDVPGVSTDQARVKVERASPFSVSTSPDVFSIGPARALPWETWVVDDKGNAGLWTSLELDSDQEPHMSYYDLSGSDLRYAYKSGGTWNVDTVDVAGITGRYSSLALDASDNPHISYHNVTDFDLKYAVKAGGGWTVETVDSTDDVGAYTSIVVDNEGNPHISYRDFTFSSLKYAVKSAGVWSTETVEGGISPFWTSLALDSKGRPHVAYDASVSSDLHYAEKSSGSWIIETVDGSGTVGPYVSLALDDFDMPHISYYDEVNGDLKLAVKANGTWSIVTVDSANDVGRENSLTLDDDGIPHLSYFDTTEDDLKYATRFGKDWETAVVEEEGLIGVYTSIEIDDENIPRISYHDFTNGRLKYASPALESILPTGGTTWPVGSNRSIGWEGTGVVDISLSVDGGASHVQLAAGVSGGEFELTVPHTPSKFCLVRVERREENNDFGSYVYPYSSAESDSFFTIETTIALLMMLVSPAEDGRGLVVSWSTDPGPEDLSGYRLEKAPRGGDYFTLVSRTQVTTYHDIEGGAGATYRLFAINGLGEEIYLGEAENAGNPVMTRPIEAYPLPFQGGELTINFALGSFGGIQTMTEVAIYDVLGRRVATVAHARFSGAVGQVTWDGRDVRGNAVASGIYFIRVRDDRGSSTRKIQILR